jgi:hypothetical protein
VALVKPIVIKEGRLQQISAGDYLAGPVWQAFTVDFGAPGATSQVFDVAMPPAVAGDMITATVGLETPDGQAQSVLELNPIIVSAKSPTNGVVRLAVNAGAVITGQRRINVVVWPATLAYVTPPTALDFSLEDNSQYALGFLSIGIGVN